jgi:hypothetical protein
MEPNWYRFGQEVRVLQGWVISAPFQLSLMVPKRANESTINIAQYTPLPNFLSVAVQCVEHFMRQDNMVRVFVVAHPSNMFQRYEYFQRL